MSQQQQLNISLDKTLPIDCEECGNDSFQQILFLRKVSKFLAGTAEDGVIPIPSFACTKCGYVNQEFKPNTKQAEA